jgi:hypothetical protein
LQLGLQQDMVMTNVLHLLLQQHNAKAVAAGGAAVVSGGDSGATVLSSLHLHQGCHQPGR